MLSFLSTVLFSCLICSSLLASHLTLLTCLFPILSFTSLLYSTLLSQSLFFLHSSLPYTSSKTQHRDLCAIHSIAICKAGLHTTKRYTCLGKNLVSSHIRALGRNKEREPHSIPFLHCATTSTGKICILRHIASQYLCCRNIAKLGSFPVEYKRIQTVGVKWKDQRCQCAYGCRRRSMLTCPTGTKGFSCS